jgi:hypothetical protein
MSIASSTNPAMQLSGDPTHYFDNYPASPTYNWGVASGNAQFGFTVEPQTAADLASTFLDNGSSCGGGSYHAEKCWTGFNSTTSLTIINRSTRTDNVTGEDEVIKFQAQANNNVLENGIYASTVTATVASN